MTEAKIVWVNIEPNRNNPEQTQMSVGYEVNGETHYMRYCLAGGTEGQQKFASMQLSKILKGAGPIKVTTKQNERGYTDVYYDDGFHSGGSDAGGF